jgi:hypothetical protein
MNAQAISKMRGKVLETGIRPVGRVVRGASAVDVMQAMVGC